MTDLHPIAAALRDIRHEMGLSQQDVADRAGRWGRSVICDYEHGRRQPRLDSLTDWAGALGYIVTLEKAVDE